MDYQEFLKSVKNDLPDVLEDRIGDVTIEEQILSKKDAMAALSFLIGSIEKGVHKR